MSEGTAVSPGDVLKVGDDGNVTIVPPVPENETLKGAVKEAALAIVEAGLEVGEVGITISNGCPVITVKSKTSETALQESALDGLKDLVAALTKEVAE